MKIRSLDTATVIHTLICNVIREVQDVTVQLILRFHFARNDD